MRKILQIDNPADSIAESAGFPLLGAVHPQVEGVGGFPQAQDGLGHDLFQGHTHPVGTVLNDPRLTAAAKLSCLNFFFTDLTSKSSTLLLGRTKAQAVINPESSSTV